MAKLAARSIIEREWVKGLNAPTGLALYERTLYAADVDELVEINAASGEIVKRYPAKGAIFLNDVAVGEDGTVYASDTPMNTIWRLKDGAFEPWLANDTLNGPNGLIVQGDKLIVETTHLKEAVDQGRYPHSANAKIVEEYSMVVNDDGTKVLTSKMTMTDPDFYTQTITAEKKWQFQPGVRLLPYECNEPAWEEHLERLRQGQADNGD